MTVLKTRWRNEIHFQEIKKKLKKLKQSDYIVVINPTYDFKALRVLGFFVRKIKIDSPYDNHGYYRGENPMFYRVIITKSEEELNYLRVSHSKAIYDYAMVADIITGAYL